MNIIVTLLPKLPKSYYLTVHEGISKAYLLSFRGRSYFSTKIWCLNKSLGEKNSERLSFISYET